MYVKSLILEGKGLQSLPTMTALDWGLGSQEGARGEQELLRNDMFLCSFMSVSKVTERSSIKPGKVAKSFANHF